MDKQTQCRSRRESARYRVFGFPWGGGGSGFYARWCKYIPDHIEVHGIRLPGRESRLNEPPCRNLEALVKDIATNLLPKLKEKPFVFCGHSLGASLCYELARYLVTHHNLQPIHIIASGTFGPFSPLRAKYRSDWTWMSDEEFVTKLRELGGTPPDLLADEDLLKTYLPSMRADIEMALRYGDEPAPPEPPISCPITFFDGLEDRVHPPEEWAEATSSTSFHTELFPGGHFFLLEDIHTRRICQYISNILPYTVTETILL